MKATLGLTLLFILMLNFCTKSSTVLYETTQSSISNSMTGIDIYGDYAIVSSVVTYYNSGTGKYEFHGSVFIFKRNLIDDIWVEMVELSSNITSSGYESIAIYDDYAIIGYPKDNDNRGSVHVWKRTDDSWAEMTKITLTDGLSDDYFGSAVSIKRNYLLITSGRWYQNSAVYVFKRNFDETWSEIDILIPSDHTINESIAFGGSLFLDETCNYAIIGAPRDDEYYTANGAVYVYFKNSDETWSEIAKIVGTTLHSSKYFGTSVAMSNDHIIIGEPGEVNIYKINMDNNQIELIQTIKDWSNGGVFNFGQTVRVDGDYLVINNCCDEDEVHPVYLYQRNNQNDELPWQEINELLPKNQSNLNTEWSARSPFGKYIAINNMTIIISAEELNGNGIFYVFEKKITGSPTIQPTLYPTTSEPTSNSPTPSPIINIKTTSTPSIFISETGTETTHTPSSPPVPGNSTASRNPLLWILFILLRLLLLA